MRSRNEKSTRHRLLSHSPAFAAPVEYTPLKMLAQGLGTGEEYVEERNEAEIWNQWVCVGYYVTAPTAQIEMMVQ